MLGPHPYFSLLLAYLCHESPSSSISQFLFVWLITSMSFLVSYNHLDLFVAFSCRFCLSTWLLVFNIGHFVCHLIFFVALATTLFVVSRHLIEDILWCYHLCHYRIIIPLLAIRCSDLYYLFGLSRLSRLVHVDWWFRFWMYFFYVFSLSFSCDLLQMQQQHYCICLSFEEGVG
jgi:hypothetical protein